MSDLKTRTAIESYIDSQLPSGTGAITAANTRDTLKAIVRSTPMILEAGDIDYIVTNMTTTTPPGSPSDGDTYVVGASATGAWSGQDDDVAIWDANESPAAWNFVTPTDGMAVWNLADDTEYRWDAGVSPAAWSAQPAGSTPTEGLQYAVSDETSDLTTGTAKITFRMPYAFTLSAVRASVATAPTGAALTVDINEGGTTILSTKLTIDAGEKTSTTAATAAVISDTALADDAEMTIDIDTVGSTIAGAGLKVTLIGTQA